VPFDPESTIVRLMIGATQPRDAPEDLLLALDSIEVVQGITCPSGFRLSFAADRYPPDPGPLPEYPVLATGLLDPFNRVQVLTQQQGESPTVLIDGFITYQEVKVEENGRALISVLGEDVSLKMDLVEVSAEYPNLTDSAIVTQVLGKYGGVGITPRVTAPSDESAPQDYVPQQNATDRFYVQALAARHGFLFYVQPGSSAGTNTAYWGPPVTAGSSQKALTANMGRATNLRSLSLRYEALAPTVAYGQVLDLSQQPAAPVPVGVGAADPSDGLATTGALPSSGSSLAQDPAGYGSDLAALAVRGSLLLHPGMTTGEARSLAQGKVNRSLQDAVVVEGEIDTSDYGEVLVAPGLVDLRGVGTRYDGTYMVKQVRHLLRFAKGQLSYMQKFVLTRGGVGSTISEVEEI
jgi:phage protein D